MRAAAIPRTGPPETLEAIDAPDRPPVRAPIASRSQDFVEAVLAATGDEGVDVVLDSIGGRTIGKILLAVRD